MNIKGQWILYKKIHTNAEFNEKERKSSTEYQRENIKMTLNTEGKKEYCRLKIKERYIKKETCKITGRNSIFSPSI